MRLAPALFLWLTISTAALGQTIIKLDVEGEGIKTLVTKLPVKVKAQPGADFYVWNYPNNVTAATVGANEQILEIQIAPVGELVISVQTLTIDITTTPFKKIKSAGRITMVIGEMPIPPPPPGAPTITSVIPATGTAGTLIKITGSNFNVSGRPVTALTTVNIGGKFLQNTLIGADSITGTIPILPTVGQYEITVSTVNGSARSPFTYTLTPIDPAPIPLDGFRVMIVEESSKRISMPPQQLSILSAASIRQYFRDNCVKGPQGKEEARIFDRDTPIVGDGKHWTDALEKTKSMTVPYIVVSNGKTGIVAPLPPTVADTITLMDKYKVK